MFALRDIKDLVLDIPKIVFISMLISYSFISTVFFFLFYPFSLLLFFLKIILFYKDNKMNTMLVSSLSFQLKHEVQKDIHIFWHLPIVLLEGSSIFDTCYIHQIRSAAQSCPTLCDPMNRSMPGLPVHHQLPEFTQTHVHPVGDAIQPSHPLSSPSPPAPNPSQHQSL